MIPTFWDLLPHIITTKLLTFWSFWDLGAEISLPVYEKQKDLTKKTAPFLGVNTQSHIYTQFNVVKSHKKTIKIDPFLGQRLLGGVILQHISKISLKLLVLGFT